MIIGIDHIALSAIDIDKATDLVSEWGYRSKFINRRLINSPIKTSYLKEKNRLHDISYCQSLSPGLPIELTVHGKKFIGKEASPYKIAITGKNPGIYYNDIADDHSENCEILKDIFGSSVTLIQLPEFQTSCYYINNGSKQHDDRVIIECILIKAFNLDKSVEFWAKFGFSEKKTSTANQEKSWKLLEFKNHIFPWGLDLILTKAKTKFASRIYQLDRPGFTCLAFITNNIFTERQRLKSEKIDVTEISSIEVGGKTLKICLCGNPDGGTLELIQISKA